MKTNLYFHQAMSKIITVAFAGLFGIYSLVSGVKEVKTEKAEDFQPVLRFAVCSDVHLGEDENGQKNAKKFRGFFDKVYELSRADKNHGTLDAVIVAGDMTEEGKAEQYKIYKEITDENLKEETKLITVMGNHEQIAYRDTATPEKAAEVFEKYIGEKTDTHNVIGGYHFIGLSYDNNGQEAFKTKLTWLREQLDEAVKDTGDKPIFVFQHPHAALTVYGSVNWANMDIRRIFKDYPQVVDFSGHSHYAANDPRSIHQSTFTAIGCGAITGAMGNLSYISGDEYGDGESATFWLCEVNENGDVRLRLYDLVSDCYYDGVDYLLKDVGNKRKRAYTWGRMMAQDTAPTFPEKAKISADINEKGEVSISFPEASGYYRAENYKITLSGGGQAVSNMVVLSDYTRAKDFEKTVSFGELKEGQYTVKIRAFSPYAKRGETLEWGFTVGENGKIDAQSTETPVIKK